MLFLVARCAKLRAVRPEFFDTTPAGFARLHDPRPVRAAIAESKRKKFATIGQTRADGPRRMPVTLCCRAASAANPSRQRAEFGSSATLGARSHPDLGGGR